MGKLIGLIIVVLILTVGVFVFTKDSGEVVGTGEDSVTKEVIEKFDKVPEFSLPDYDGNKVSQSDFPGKVLVINSWAVWCPFCVNELPTFAELQEEFSEEIVVIAIDRDEPLEKAKKFSDELGVTDKIIFLLDPKDSFYKSIGGFSMPETLFVDTNGNIRIHKRGPMEIEEMREKVKEVLSSLNGLN